MNGVMERTKWAKHVMLTLPNTALIKLISTLSNLSINVAFRLTYNNVIFKSILKWQ